MHPMLGEPFSAIQFDSTPQLSLVSISYASFIHVCAWVFPFDIAIPVLNQPPTLHSQCSMSTNINMNTTNTNTCNTKKTTNHPHKPTTHYQYIIKTPPKRFFRAKSQTTIRRTNFFESIFRFTIIQGKSCNSPTALTQLTSTATVFFNVTYPLP